MRERTLIFFSGNHWKTIAFTLLLLPFLSYAQNNDCEQAIVICSSGSIGTNPSGPGTNDFGAGSSSGCLESGENQSSWYYFEMNDMTPAGSTLEFTITPDGGAAEDYDFAVFGPDVECGALGGPILCSFAASDCALCPDTGAGNGASDFSEGAFGDGFVSPLTVNAGEGYYILIDNFLSTSTGFTMTWGGDGAPFLDCTATPGCALIADVSNPAITQCHDAGPISLNGFYMMEVGAVSINWIGSGGEETYLTNPNINDPILNLPPGFSGTFTLTYEVTDDDCTMSADVVITILPPPTISIDDPGVICSNQDFVMLNASPPGGVWSGDVDPAGIITPGSMGTGFFSATYSYTDPTSGCSNSESISFEILPFFEVHIVPDGNPIGFCAEDNFVTIQAIPVGGMSPFDFVWTMPNGANSSGSVINAIMPGTYTVIVTDQSGCSGTNTAEVIIFDPTPTLILDPGELCPSGTHVSITAFPPGGTFTGPGTFITPEGTILSSEQVPGTYPIIYESTDINGCVSSEMIDIVFSNGPMASASNDGPYCAGQTINLFGITSATGSVDYLWTGPGTYTSTQQNPTDATDPGEYMLTVTANGCSSPPQSTVVVLTAQPDATATNDGPVCSNETINLNSSTTTIGTVITYAWTGPGTYTSSDQNPTGITESGEYTVIITIDGCNSEPATTAVEIYEEVIAMASNDGPYCPGDPINLTSSSNISNDESYNWSGPGSYASTEQNPSDATEPGEYTVEISANGCSASAFTTVIIEDLPNPIISGDTEFCEGMNTVLSVDGGPYSSYLWSTSETTATITVSSSGTYMVDVTNVAGCEGNDDIEIVVNENPEFTINGPNSICPGTAGILEVPSDLGSVLWSTGETTFTIEITDANTYTATITSPGGCVGEASIEVEILAEIDFDINGEASFCENGETTLSAPAGFNYIWSTSETTQSIGVNTSNTFSVTITNASGCSGIDDITTTSHPNPSPAITGDLEFCEGNSTLLGLTDSYSTITWSTGITSPTIMVSTTETILVDVVDDNGCTGSTSVNVISHPLPEPAITGPNSICLGNEALLGTTEIFDSYLWSTGETTPEITVTDEGVYAVDVTDNNGCEGTANFNLSIEDELTFTITGETTICQGASTTLAAPFDSDYSYLWSTGSVDQMITVSTSGDYTVVISNSSGCSGSADIDVDVSPNLAPLILGDMNFCEGGQTELSLDQAYSNIMWSTGETTPTILINTAETILVEVEDDNGCTGMASTVITVFANPEPVILGPNSICTGNSATLSLNEVFSSYLWSTGESSDEIIVTSADTYSIDVVDANGCTGTAFFTLTIEDELTFNIDGELEICEGSSTTLSAPVNTDYSYLWNTGSTNPMIIVNDGGNYSVVISNSSGCSGNQEVDVIVNPEPAPMILGLTSFCENGNTTLELDQEYTVMSWSNGSTTQSTSVSSSGLVTVNIEDINGCTASVDVSITVFPNPSIEISGPSTICTGSSAILSVPDGFSSYTWSNSETTSSIEVTEAGDYTVDVIDVNGCTGSDLFNVSINNNIEFDIIGTTSICEGSQTELFGPPGLSNYSWSTKETTPSIIVNQTGSYALTVSDATGCTGANQTTVIVYDNPSVDISGASTICIGSSTILSTTETYSSYLWSTGSTDPQITVTTGGSYTLEIIDANGCAGFGTFNVAIDTELSPEISGSLTFCAGGETTLSAGLGFATYLWSTGETTPTIIANTSGPVSVEVTDAGGCAGSTSVDIAEIPEIEVELAPNTLICNTTAGGSTLDLNSLILSGDITGFWTDISSSGAPLIGSSIDFNGVTEGTYEFEYTTAAAIAPCPNRTFILTIIVKECACPIFQFLPAGNLCNEGGNFDLESINSNGYGGVWSLTGSPTGSNPAILTGSMFTANNSDPGLYQFTFTVTDALPPGCDNTAMLELLVISQPNSGVATAIDENCEGNGTVLDLNSYLIGADPDGTWISNPSNPASTQDLLSSTGIFDGISAQTGNYTFTYSIQGNGSCPSASTSVLLTVNPNPILELNSSQVITCDNPSFDLNATVDLTGSEWTINWTGPTFSAGFNSLTPTVVSGGTYELIYSNSLTGCFDQVSVSVVENTTAPMISMDPEGVLTCNEPSINLTAITNGMFEYLWSGTGIAPGDENLVSPTISEAGIYSLIVSDPSNGCPSENVETVITKAEAPVALISNPVDTLNCIFDNTFLTSIDCDINADLSALWYFESTLISNDCEIQIFGDSGLGDEQEYMLVIEDITTGCKDTTYTQILDNTSFPGGQAEGAAIDCRDTFAILEGSSTVAAEYTWINPLEEISSGATLQTDLPGLYQFVSMETVSGCSDTIPVVVEDLSISFLSSAGEDEDFNCDYTPITLIGQSELTGSTFTWFDPDGNIMSQNQNAIAESVGMYTLLVVDENTGCESKDFVFLNDPQNFPVGFDIIQNNPKCAGQTNGIISINQVDGGTGPFNFSINGQPFSSNPTFSNLAPGDYVIATEDSEGCEFEQLLNIPVPDSTFVGLGTDIELETGDSTNVIATISVPMSSLDTLIWEPAQYVECLNEDCSEVEIQSPESFNLEVYIRTEDGCEANDNIQVKVSKNNEVYWPSAFAPQSSEGANTAFMPWVKTNKVDKIENFIVADRWGEILYRMPQLPLNDLSFGWNGKIGNVGKTLNPGVFVYYAKVTYKDGTVEEFKGDVTLIR